MIRFAIPEGGRLPAALLALALVALGHPARAETVEGFALDRFEPGERGSGWLVLDTLDFGTSVGATLDYAHEPLVARDPSGAQRASIVRHQAFVHAGAALAVTERVRFALNVPLAIYQDGEPVNVGGDTLKAASAPALGDVRVAADVRLVGDGRGLLALGAGVRAWLPTGVRGQYTGDGAVRLAPQLIAAGAIGIVGWSARGAFVFRAHDAPYAGADLGSELAIAGGVAVRAGAWQIGPEVFASSVLTGGLLRADTTPLEALLGGRWEAPFGLRLGGGVGTSLAQAYGSPAARVLFSVEWSAPRGSVEERDRDGDGVSDSVDACPDWPGPKSAEPSENGCPRDERVPDEDTDGDGIWDRDDACPVAKGVATSDPMTNGCPEGEPRKLAVVTAHEIKIGDQVRFATNSAELVPESDTVLEAVRMLLVDHPEIVRVRVEGHTDDVGDPGYNDVLSERRATSVTTWLVTRGIHASRLESVGKGAREPLERSGSDEARAKNRRVVFVVVERRAAR